MSLVGFAYETHAGIRLGIDGDGGHAEAVRGPDYPAGDLAAIGNQNLFEHRPYIRKRPNRGCRGIGAFSVAPKARPSTSRVWSGSMIPSSQSLAVAKNGLPSSSYLCRIGALK